MIKKLGESCLIIGGTGKISVGVLTPVFLKDTNKTIILITTSEKYKEITKVEIKDHPELSYTIFYAPQDIEDLESLLMVMGNKGIRVVVVNVKHKVFKELVARNDICTWYMACREGIFFYLSFLIQPGEVHKQIISFDNDYAMVNKAKELAKGTNISVCKAVIHSVCSSAQVNDENRSVELVVSDECWMVFPPEVYYIKYIMDSKQHMFARRALMYFTKLQEEFQYWLLAKKIDINALHTLLSAVAYVEGYKKGLDKDEVAIMRYEDVISKEAVWPMLCRTHEILYNLYLREYAQKCGDNLDLHRFRLQRFIDGLFDSAVDTVGRGLNFSADGWKSKLSDHIPLLRSSEDVEVIRILDNFNEII